MCGFAGLVYFEQGREVSVALVRAMAAAAAHRGPDAEGLWVQGRWGLGFRRLSIIDLSEKGNQPMHNEDGTVHVVVNGEIYNYRALRAQLEVRGHRFVSQADSETVVHAYEEYGEEFVEHLNGMFGLAVADTRRGRLVVARDRLGIKPVYYRVTGQGVWFGSELKCLLEDETVEKRVDRLALNMYMVREVVPAPMSIYEGIGKLEAGEMMTVDLERGQRGVRRRRYWRLRFEEEERTEQAWVELLGEQLAAAVGGHMVSDVEVGAFLSGGMDSSVVTALMRQRAARVRTFTVGFEEAEADEGPVARAVAAALGTEHVEMTARVDSVALLDKLVGCYDEPFGDSSALPTYMIAAKAREHVKVILSGDGGDELFGGYFSGAAVRRIEQAARVPVGAGKAGALLGGCVGGETGRRLQRLGLPDWLRHATLHSHVFDKAWREALRPEWRVSREEVLGTYEPLREELEGLGALNQCMAAYFRTYLPDDIQTKVDRASSAHGLEVRVPLLDYRLVELAARMPTGMKFRGAERKYVLRQAARAWLPKVVFEHPKHGFAVPTERWGRTVWREQLGRWRREARWLDEVIDFGGMQGWSGSLTWNVLFLARWLMLQGREVLG